MTAEYNVKCDKVLLSNHSFSCIWFNLKLNWENWRKVGKQFSLASTEWIFCRDRNSYNNKMWGIWWINFPFQLFQVNLYFYLFLVLFLLKNVTRSLLFMVFSQFFYMSIKQNLIQNAFKIRESIWNLLCS